MPLFFVLKLVLDLCLKFLLIVHLMQGVNRALPYVASSEVDDIVEVQTPILFRLVRLLTSESTLLSCSLKDIIASCKDPN